MIVDSSAGKLDDFTRTERGQVLLGAAQEARARKRAIDPTWAVLDAVEAINAAASSLESGNPDAPTLALATRLRRCVDYLLDVEARLGEYVVQETIRDLGVDFRRPSTGETPNG